MEEKKSERLWSLDALRGFDMLFITGLGGAIAALSTLVTGNSGNALALQMQHVAWEGFRQRDTIFPLFIFLAGVAYPFSCAAARLKGMSTAALVRKATVRLVMLVFLGLVYGNFLQFDFAHQRWASVLARIGMAWYGAAMLYLFVRSVRARAAIFWALLVGYWAVCFFVTAPDAPAGAGSFSEAGCFAGWIDRKLLPGLYAGRFLDPEGILSVFPSVALAMGGVFAGELVRSERFSGGRKAAILASLAAFFCVLTFAWQPWCPIIKKIWTSTFITASLAYSFACFAIFYWVIDVLKFRSWTYLLRIVGMNAITLYLLRRIVAFGPISKFLFGGVISLFPSSWSGLLFCIGELALDFAILAFLHRHKVFLKV